MGIMKTERLVAGKVYTLEGDPVTHASVGIENNAAAPYRIVQTDNQGEFRADYQFYEETDAVKHFAVTLQVSKKGFRVTRKIAEIATSNTVAGIPVTLRPLKPEDPSLLSQAELIKSLAPRLRQLGLTDGLSAKDEKDYARGVQEFLDRNHLDRAVPLFSKVAKRNPSCLRCRTMLALAELSWGDWDDARVELGESINALIADRKLGSPEPLLAYGVLLTWDREPAKASSYLAEALKYAPQDALALQEHGRAQCLESNWEAGSESLKAALAAGAGPEARLMLAESLLWAGTPDEATAELTRYLDGRDLGKMPPRVRSLSSRIQDRKKDDAAFLAANAKARARGEEAIDYLHHPPQNLPDFEPATDQAPLDAILVAVGENVAKLFAGLPNISAVENVHQERLSRKGKPGSARENKYRYLCMTPAEQWGPSIDEYRSDLHGKEISQVGLSEGYMLTAGFASAPLVFHPAYQSGSAFRLLGHQKVKGRNTFVVAFAQYPARSRIYGIFQDGRNTKTMFKQGIAWIDSENYQIIRLTSDLLKPLSQIKLERLTTEIDLSEVSFNQVRRRFWLPNQVTVTLDWNGRVLRNKHEYSDFLVFKVESKEKLGELKGAGQPAEGTEDPAPREKPLKNSSLSLAPQANKP
jgi:tetratricopeptide (TPR) repeat protein